MSKCPICSLVQRATENSPPLLLEEVALPALLGGSWLSARCESISNGLWARRQLQMYSGDKLWNGRWDYYKDPQCSLHIYSITAAGSYIQRAGRQRRHDEMERYAEENLFPNEFKAGFSDDEASMALDTDVKSYSDLSRRKRETSSTKMKTFLKNISPQLSQAILDSLGLRNPEEFTPNAKEMEKNWGISFKWDEDNDENLLMTPRTSQDRKKRSTQERDSYRHLFEDAQPSMVESLSAMLRGNQPNIEPIKKPMRSTLPAGTTELDLHVAESFLIPGDSFVANRCGSHLSGINRYKAGGALVSWPKSCVPHSLEAPSTIGLRARLGLNWVGQYTLKLGSRDVDLWDTPLYQCGPTNFHNPALRAQLRRSLGIKFGLYSSAASFSQSYWFIGSQLFFYLFYRLMNY